MHHRSAFALPDLLATTIIVGTLLALTAATLADNDTRRQREQNATQLRGIHQGLTTFANSNKENYPGLDSRSNILENSDADTGDSGDGDTPEARFWILLSSDFIAEHYAIAPIDQRAEVYVQPQQQRGRRRGAARPMTHVNYSYALLDISGDASDRTAEWQQSLNWQSIVVSDRNCADLNEEGADPTSIWDETAWAGHVLWNDNHVEYTADDIHETRYANGELNIDENGDSTDHLFTSDTEEGSDAYMTFSRDEDGNERAVPRVIEDEDEAGE